MDIITHAATDVNPAKPSFAGFKPLKANFTQTPNQFFDRIVGNYHPCVVTVVAILIRATLGWEDPDTNERRAEADLPLSAFVRSELSESSARKGIAGAIEAGFMVQTVPATNRQSARYALRWDDPEQQKRALQKQRRAQGGMKRRGAAVMESKWKKRGVTVAPLEIDNTAPEVRGATVRGLTVRGLTVTPPIYKESLKKSSSEKKEERKEKKEEPEKSFSLSLSQIAEQKEQKEAEQEKPLPIPVPEKKMPIEWDSLGDKQQPFMLLAEKDIINAYQLSGKTPPYVVIENRARTLYNMTIQKGEE